MITRFTHNRSVLEYCWNEDYAEIFCFSTTRHGGYGSGEYDSFNCSGYCGDENEVVKKNRCRLMGLLPEPVMLVTPRQTHGNKVADVDRRFLEQSAAKQESDLEGVDALVTSVPGVCIGVFTADCIPVFLYDRVNRVVAVAHAGWRGTCRGVVTRTLQLMNRGYGTCPEDLMGCIGPGISVDAFEVGEEVWQGFHEAGFPMDRIAWRDRKWHIDLWKANCWLLEEAGVPSENIMVSSVCTWSNNEDFFSARRQGIASGRMLNGILIR